MKSLSHSREARETVSLQGVIWWRIDALYGWVLNGHLEGKLMIVLCQNCFTSIPPCASKPHSPHNVFSHYIWCQPLDYLSPTCILFPSANFIGLSQGLPFSHLLKSPCFQLKLSDKPCVIVYCSPLMLPLRFYLLPVLLPDFSAFSFSMPPVSVMLPQFSPRQLICSCMPLHSNSCLQLALVYFWYLFMHQKGVFSGSQTPIYHSLTCIVYCFPDQPSRVVLVCKSWFLISPSEPLEFPMLFTLWCPLSSFSHSCSAGFHWEWL